MGSVFGTGSGTHPVSTPDSTPTTPDNAVRGRR
jgi:hypothetical protein